jgi:HAD superfamily PSPase-like hydrolase
MSKIKLVVFDMDGTLLKPRSCWAQIHEHFGTDNRDMLKLYVEHKISDQEFVKADVKTWEEKSDVKVDEKYVNSILDQIEPRDGAEELVVGLHNKGIETIFLTGGIKFLADKWAKQWNMKKPLANDLIDGKNGLMVHVNASGHAKGPVMDQLLKKMELSKEDVAAVGDTVVDLPLFERAGLSIAVNTNQKDVFENANYHHNGDLRELINIISTW